MCTGSVPGKQLSYHSAKSNDFGVVYTDSTRQEMLLAQENHACQPDVWQTQTKRVETLFERRKTWQMSNIYMQVTHPMFLLSVLTRVKKGMCMMMPCTQGSSEARKHIDPMVMLLAINAYSPGIFSVACPGRTGLCVISTTPVRGIGASLPLECLCIDNVHVLDIKKLQKIMRGVRDSSLRVCMLQLTPKNTHVDALQHEEVQALDKLIKHIVANISTCASHKRHTAPHWQTDKNDGVRDGIHVLLSVLCAHGYLHMHAGDEERIQERFVQNSTKRIWVSNDNGTIPFLKALNFFKQTALMGDLCGNEMMQQICETTPVPFVFGKYVMMGEVARILKIVVESIGKRVVLSQANTARVIKSLAACMMQKGEALSKKAENTVQHTTVGQDTQQKGVYATELRNVVVQALWQECWNMVSNRQVSAEYEPLMTGMFVFWGEQTSKWTRRPLHTPTDPHSTTVQTVCNSPVGGWREPELVLAHTRGEMKAMLHRTTLHVFENECRTMIRNVTGLSACLHEMMVCTPDDVEEIQAAMQFVFPALPLARLDENVKQYEIHNTGVHLLSLAEPILFPNTRPNGGYKLPLEVVYVCQSMQDILYKDIPVHDARFDTIQTLRVDIVANLLHFLL